MGRKLVLTGGGGHCKSVLDAVLRNHAYSKIVITDPSIAPGTSLLGCTVVGNDEMLLQLRKDGFDNAFITVGGTTDFSIREKLYRLILSLGYEVPVIIDPSAVVSASSHIGSGSFIGKNVIVNTDSRIGENCIINSGAIIEHECMIGNDTHISVGAILCGNVSISNSCFVGAGSTVIQGLRIEKNAIIGAHSTVLRDVCANEKVYGTIK